MWSMFPGRLLYAAAIIGFGVLGVAYAAFINSLQPVPESMPGYGPLAVLTGLFLILAGFAVLTGFLARPAALAVAGMFGLGILVLHVPSAFTNPELLRSPWWIRTFESLALGGAALIVAGLAARPVRPSWVRAGRIAFGVSLPVFGILHFVYPASVAALVETASLPLPWPLFWAYLTGAGHFAAGVAIATGILARWAAWLAGLMYGSWAVTLHLHRVLSNPPGFQGDRPELTSLLVCVAFWGAAWIVAASVAGNFSRTEDT